MIVKVKPKYVVLEAVQLKNLTVYVAWNWWDINDVYLENNPNEWVVRIQGSPRGRAIYTDEEFKEKFEIVDSSPD